MNPETWWDRTMVSADKAKKYMRSNKNGVGFPSRNKLLELVQDGESLLECKLLSPCRSSSKILVQGRIL